MNEYIIVGKKADGKWRTIKGTNQRTIVPKYDDQQLVSFKVDDIFAVSTKQAVFLAAKKLGSDPKNPIYMVDLDVVRVEQMSLMDYLN